MARKKLKKFTTLELMLSILLLVVFIITIPIFVLSARDSLESQGNKEVWSYPSTCFSFQSRNFINGREVMPSCSLVWACMFVLGTTWLKLWQCSSAQSLSRVRLPATPRTAARQASLSITNSQSLLKPKSIESVMPSSHLILSRPLLFLPPIPPSISLFQWVNSLHEVAKVLEFQL